MSHASKEPINEHLDHMTKNQPINNLGVGSRGKAKQTRRLTTRGKTKHPFGGRRKPR